MKPTTPIQKDKTCFFCENGLKEVDWKNIQILQKFTSSYGKIIPRKRSGLCSKHQRKIAHAVKRARFLGLIPFSNK